MEVDVAVTQQQALNIIERIEIDDSILTYSLDNLLEGGILLVRLSIYIPAFRCAMKKETETKIGIVGTGFIAQGLSYALRNDESLRVSRVLTRRDRNEIRDLAIAGSQITNSTQELIDNSDLIVECSGDPVYATEVISSAMDAGLKVITMDSELQVTTGSWLAKRGYITEAEGDQPGSIAALYKDVIGMGFEPIVLGNIKGFLNDNPTERDMKYFAAKNGISLEQVISFTDGTKIQTEQALVANGLNFDIAKRGLIGMECVDYNDGARQLAEKADSLGIKISDYVLSPKSPPGVFIAAKHDREQAHFLKYYKLGDGPYYVITRPFHLCHLEISKTIRHVLMGGEVLLNNGKNPTVSVATVTKRRLIPGEIIKRGIGSFEVRGEAIKIADLPGHLPIGLVFDVVVKRYIERGEIISFEDVEIPQSQALVAWQDIIKQK